MAYPYTATDPMRCVCWRNVRAVGQGDCAACRLHNFMGTYERGATKNIGLRERIKARWPSYDAVGQTQEVQP